jgi:DNA repair protein RecO (recombination protein O)
MMTNSRAIVLNTLKFGEQQLIVDMLTEELGRVSFICRIPKTQKGKLKKQFFQPLSLLDAVFDYRQNARLQHLRDVRLSQPFTSIPFDAGKLSIALFLAEFLTYATRDEQQNAALFNYVVNSISWLDGQTTSFANFHLVFMMRLSRFIGFFPNTDGAEEGGYFDLLGACFTPAPPLHGHFLTPDEASKISLLMRLNYKTMHLCAMTREERNRCTEVIVEYYRLHVPGFPALRSLDVLRQLFV